MSKLSFTLLIGVLFLFGLYLPINIEQDRLYSFETFIDNYIPLVTAFMTVYISYGLFLVFTFFYFLKKSARQLNTVLASIIISCLCAYFIYLFFQNSIIRPEIVVNNVFDETYRLVNIWMAPYNAFPSLHVAISTICAIGFWKIKSNYFKVMLVWAVLIIISTVLTKQHYFLDVLGGLVLAFLSFKAAEIIIKKIDKSGRITQ